MKEGGKLTSPTYWDALTAKEGKNKKKGVSEKTSHDRFHDKQPDALHGFVFLDGRANHLLSDEVQPDVIGIRAGKPTNKHFIAWLIEFKAFDETLGKGHQGQSIAQGVKLLETQPTRRFTYTVLTNFKSFIFFKVSRKNGGGGYDVSQSETFNKDAGLSHLMGLLSLSDEDLGFGLVLPTVSDLEFGEALGQGLTSVVYHATFKRQACAAKCFLTGTFTFSQITQILHSLLTLEIGNEKTKEAEVLSHVDHPSIPKIIETEEKSILLITPVLQPLNHVSGAQARNLFEALTHTHTAGYLHRDIRKDNVMRSADRAFLIDFGFAILKEKASEEAYAGAVRTASTKVLEALRDKKQVTFTELDDFQSLAKVRFFIFVVFNSLSFISVVDNLLD
jgi:tRNA A-37 threonylcarbamoyl transferase component Bud32